MHSVICSQIGAREHYAIPRALSRLGYLDALLTDVWAGGYSSRLTRVTYGRRFAARRHNEIPDDRVVAFTASTLARDALRRLSNRRLNIEETYLDYVRVGNRFACKVDRYLRKRFEAGQKPSAFFSYTTGALETLDFLADAGVPRIVDQIDPGRIVDEVASREAALWPQYSLRPGRIPEKYFQRLDAEWARATRVIINSDWSRKALIEQGVPERKLIVIPVAYDRPSTAVTRKSPGKVITVLWLGQVILLKGIQYLMQAARELHREPIRFIVAGPIGISNEAVRSAPSNMSFIGSITRDGVPSLFHDSDLFVFPTLSDGFGVVQVEAMAHGLPVIATRNCGEVVTDGLDGRVIPAGDSKSLAASIKELAGDRQRLSAMSAAAIEKSKQFSVDTLAQRLRSLLDELA